MQISPELLLQLMRGRSCDCTEVSCNLPEDAKVELAGCHINGATGNVYVVVSSDEFEGDGLEEDRRTRKQFLVRVSERKRDLQPQEETEEEDQMARLVRISRDLSAIGISAAEAAKAMEAVNTAARRSKPGTSSVPEWGPMGVAEYEKLPPPARGMKIKSTNVGPEGSLTAPTIKYEHVYDEETRELRSKKKAGK